MSLRRYYHHQLRHHRRFHVAVLLTIVAVAFVVVPAVLGVLQAVGQYDPRDYEPKDLDRGAWLAGRPVPGPPALGWNDLLKLALLILAGVAWLAVSPPGRARRR
jgi:hypothetical protein